MTEFDGPVGFRRQVIRARRHLYWARTQGVRRLIEEDQLDPVARARTAAAKRRWRAAHNRRPGEAVPVFLFGLQRSGTNMIVHGLDAAPAFEVHNENDPAVFDRFRLRDLGTVRDMVTRSHHSHVLFKPLCDSHRANEILDELGTSRRPRAIWAYRSAEGRAASAVAKFGDVNLQVLAEIARGEGGARWQAQRLSPASLELIRSFDYSIMEAATAAALFWYVRNSLFFELGLDAREDVTLASYEAFLAEPAVTMRWICRFLDFPWDPALVSHIAPRPAALPPAGAGIDPEVRRLCRALRHRLDAAAEISWARL